MKSALARAVAKSFHGPTVKREPTVDGGVGEGFPASKSTVIETALPPRIVVVNDNPPVMQALEVMVRHWLKGATLKLLQTSADAWEELSRTDPDLLWWVVSAPLLRGREMIQRLMERKVTYPIIVSSAYEPDELWVREFASRGLNVSFLPMPFTMQDLMRLLERLNIPPSRRLLERRAWKDLEAPSHPQMAPANTRCTRPLRIVVLDDEPGVREALQLLLPSYLPNSVILTFNDAELALQELEREDPDLFTTDWNHPGRLFGEGLLRILASRGVKYPIFLITAYADSIRQEIVGYANQGLNIALLAKPFSLDDLRRLVSTHLGPENGR